MKEKKFTFEEVFQQNERRIHFHINRLGIRDPYREFYVEGIYALWMAYKQYDPNKGPMSTYFNFIIRNRLIDRIRKEEKEGLLKEKIMKEKLLKGDSGNREVGKDRRLLDVWNGDVDELQLSELLEQLPSLLTKRQMKWFTGTFLHGLTQSEIAEREGVTVDAVKGWAKEARKKLRDWRDKQ